MDYNEIKRVFSIWLCVSMPENSMGYFHLKKDDLLGSYQWKGRLDLLNIIMIGITDELPEQEEGYELHRLLSVLLSMELSVAEKLEIVEREYHIPINGEMKEGLNAMCNLSQGIMEKGIKKGMEKSGALGEKRSGELAVRLVEAGRIDDLVRAAVDEGHRHKLFAEFGIS